MAGEQENTEISQVTLDNQAVAELLGIATGENVITQTAEKEKTAFTRNTEEPLDAAALEKEIAADKKAVLDAAKAKEIADAEAAALLLDPDKNKTADQIAAELNLAETEEEKKKKGRPEFQTTGLIQIANELIKEEKFIALDDPKPMEEWTKADWKEFIELNVAHREDKVKEEIPVAFFDSLPEEFQVAYNYFAQGGKDVKHILRVVSQSVETASLDVETEDGQEAVVRNYLRMRDNLTPEELDAEVDELKDKGDLEKKAKQFKPKLDAAQQQHIEKNLKAVEIARKNAEKESVKFMDSVFKSLESGVIGGVKIDRKLQGSLYNALVQPNYQSFTGGQTNELGHLLETKQFGAEKDLESVALATWLLRDKEGFLAKVREQGAQAKVTDTVKKLKIEQANRVASTTEDDNDGGAGREVKKLQRKEPVNPFKRD